MNLDSYETFGVLIVLNQQSIDITPLSSSGAAFAVSYCHIIFVTIIDALSLPISLNGYGRDLSYIRSLCFCILRFLMKLMLGKHFD